MAKKISKTGKELFDTERNRDLCLFKSQGLLALKSQSSFSHLYSVLSGRSAFFAENHFCLFSIVTGPVVDSRGSKKM